MFREKSSFKVSSSHLRITATLLPSHFIITHLCKNSVVTIVKSGDSVELIIAHLHLHTINCLHISHSFIARINGGTCKSVRYSGVKIIQRSHNTHLVKSLLNARIIHVRYSNSRKSAIIISATEISATITITAKTAAEK